MTKIDDRLRELEQKREKFLQMGGPAKVNRQHEKGWLTARERIDRLLDPGSFMEMGLFAHSDYPGMEDKNPCGQPDMWLWADKRQEGGGYCK
jgi:acetyl-CoA carboxylase carboxyltransferase component